MQYNIQHGCWLCYIVYRSVCLNHGNIILQEVSPVQGRHLVKVESPPELWPANANILSWGPEPFSAQPGAALKHSLSSDLFWDSTSEGFIPYLSLIILRNMYWHIQWKMSFKSKCALKDNCQSLSPHEYWQTLETNERKILNLKFRKTNVQ